VNRGDWDLEKPALWALEPVTATSNLNTQREKTMARVDDYRNAAELAKKALAGKDPRILAQCCGAEVSEEGDQVGLSFDFLGSRVQVAWPDVGLSRFGSPEEEISIQQQVLLLHYLEGAWRSKGAPLEGEWVAYQDVQDGMFYLDAFQRRAKIPLVSTFGEKPELLSELARDMYGTEPIDLGDVSVSVPALPRIRLALVIWAGDDEFPPEGTILFDRNTAAYLSAEDMAWLSGMVVYPLLGAAAARSGKD